MDKDEALGKISHAMRHIEPRRLDAHAVKSKRLLFRMHDEEFDEIKATAEKLGMSISEYFCALHRYAVQRLEMPDTDAKWVHRSSRKSGDDDENC